MEIDSTMVEAQKVVNKVAINYKQVFLVSLLLKRIEGGVGYLLKREICLVVWPRGILHLFGGGYQLEHRYLFKDT